MDGLDREDDAIIDLRDGPADAIGGRAADQTGSASAESPALVGRDAVRAGTERSGAAPSDTAGPATDPTTAPVARVDADTAPPRGPAAAAPPPPLIDEPPEWGAGPGWAPRPGPTSTPTPSTAPPTSPPAPDAPTAPPPGGPVGPPPSYEDGPGVGPPGPPPRRPRRRVWPWFVWVFILAIPLLIMGGCLAASLTLSPGPVAAANDFFAAIDEGRFEDARAMLCQDADVDAEQFRADFALADQITGYRFLSMGSGLRNPTTVSGTVFVNEEPQAMQLELSQVDDEWMVCSYEPLAEPPSPFELGDDTAPSG